VAKPEDAARLFEGCDVVVNCAAASGPPAVARQQDEAVLEALFALPHSVRIIHLSSVGIYGSMLMPGHGSFNKPRPDWDFGRGKLYLEQLIKRRAGGRDVLVLRLGHVYGAGQWVSRFVLQRAADPKWRLPFDGRLKANAIHVRNAAEAIRTAILSRPETGTYNLFDPGQSTWREVFDWTTNTIGLPAVPAMDEQRSEALCSAHRKLTRTPLPVRAAKEALHWVQGLPSSFFSGVPTSKALGSVLLAKLKSHRFESAVLKRWNASLADLPDSQTEHPSYLCSAEAPGPVFEFSNARGQSDEQALRSWYRKMHAPEAILNWDQQYSKESRAEQASTPAR
jgi:nucleoside-diphosphate-sugar epimerase